MRVLHILDHSLPLHSGYTFRSAAILREQRARGWETLQLTTPRHGAGAATEERVDDLLFHRTPHAPGLLGRLPVVGGYLGEMQATARRLAALVRETRPDILHAHSPVLNALPALLVGRRAGLPVLYEVRACWEDAAVDHGSTTEGSPRYRATRALETFALRRADAVTVICEGLRGEFVGRGIPAGKITLIPNAVDVDGFGPGAEPDPVLRRSLSLDGATVIGFVGSFYAYEGLDLLLRAFARLRDTHPALRVLMVGGGPQDEALQALAGELGVSDRVRFTGRVPHAQVQRYYDLIDLLVYPRYSMRLTELVTPLKPLEAMAQGRVFLASDVGGHRELVRPGETGYLFRAGSEPALAAAIDDVLQRRDEWPGLRERARRFVEKERTWKRSVDNYVAVYDSLMRSRGAAAALRPQGR